MIDLETRKAIWVSYQKGIGVNELARKFCTDKKTVRSIIGNQGEIPCVANKNKILIDKDLLQALYQRCHGMTPRMHEILKKENQIDIGYSTLTALIRKLEIVPQEKERSCQVADVPGEEFQHDTSPYVVEIDGQKIKLQASSIYFRYSKVRYLKFYPSFTKFHLRCFLYEALTFWGYVANTCVVDNSNLVVHHGTGDNAVFCEDMSAIAKQYDFKWKAHFVAHSDRKAGVEKNFHFIETNFFPGRAFFSLEDLNKKAKEWCEDVFRRPHSKTKLFPCDLWEIEKPHLKLLGQIPRPYLTHERMIDQYGFISFDGNYYWTPHGKKGTVTVLQYADSLSIYQYRKELISYPLAIWRSRGKKILPEGVNLEYKPKKSTVDASVEESTLKAIGENYQTYLKDAQHQLIRSQYCQLVRALFALSKKMDKEIFAKIIERAITFRIYDLQVIINIKNIILTDAGYTPPAIHDDFGLLDIEDGGLQKEPDFSRYDYQNQGQNSNGRKQE